MTILKGGVEGNIKKMYLFKIFSGMLFFVPIFMKFKEANGISLSEIFYLQIAFALSMVLFEIPTGYIADIYGRKKSMLIGAIIQTIGIVALSFAYGFWAFMVVEILMGLGVSLYSGANSALVYESLKELNKSSKYSKIWGNMQFYNMLAVGFSGIVGGFIGHYDLRYTIYASVPFYMMLVVIASLFKEPKRTKVVAQKGYAKEFAHGVKEVLKESRSLKQIMLYSATILAFNQSVYPMYQDYFELIGLDLFYFGVVFASFQVVSAFSSRYAYRVERFIGREKLLKLLPFVVGASYLLMGTWVFIGAFFFIYIQQFVRAFRIVVVNDSINRLVESDNRATILSVESLLGKLMLTVSLFIWGVSLEYLSLVDTLLWLGVVSMLVGAVLFIFIKKIGEEDV